MHKTNIQAEAGKQELLITRQFDLPVELLFKAYTEPELLAQWMGTKVIKLENQAQGSWRFETSNPEGQVVFSAQGTIHEFVPNQKITRTFEMENANVGIQLEFLEFEGLAAGASQLTIHTIYRSVAHRDQLLQFGMGAGLNMAHNRLQQVVRERAGAESGERGPLAHAEQG